MSGEGTPPAALPGAAAFRPDAWRLLVGEFDLRTGTTPDVMGSGSLRTLLRLRAEGDPPRVVGVDQPEETGRTERSRWPVELRGATLVVGDPAPGRDPSEYRVQWASAAGFAGEWRTRQPEWLREQQPGHPEFVSGPFLAFRMRGVDEGSSLPRHDVLTTARLRLRPLAPTDAPAVFDYARDPAVLRHTTGQTPTRLSETEEFVRAAAAADDTRHWGICLAGTDTVVGVIELGLTAASLGTIHYALGVAHWGKGLMTEAVRAVCDWTFRAVPALWAIETSVAVENVGSERVLEKVGFRRTRLVEERWQKSPEPVRLACFVMTRERWYRAELFAQVERVLDGTLPVPAFEGRFYDYFMDEVPEAALTQAERDFVEEVCEQLDVTAERPDAESRRHGWIDHAQFVEWLRARYEAFRARP